MDMRNLLLCLSVVLLASCIPVEDYGPYWKKGVVDPALLGVWQKVPVPDADDRRESRSIKSPANDGVRVTAGKGSYRIDTLDEKERQEKDYRPLIARTLKDGPYTFLMANDGPNPDFIRYVLKDGTAAQYRLEGAPMGRLLKEKYPHAKNIGTNCKWAPLCIRKFDAEVYAILAAIPDTPEYWTLESRFRRRDGR